MATEWQNPPDADVILRAPGGKEFHAHKLVLSLASSVFRDMLSIPQISTDKDSSKLPIIDVDDPPETLEIFLQIIYPIRNTPIDNLETLATVLKLADKYDAKALLDKDYLPSTYASSPPIHMYAISCAYGREKEAEVAARRAPLASLELLSPPLLQLMTLGQYHQLMKFMVTRDKKMRDVLDRYRSIMPINCTSKACQDALNQSYLGTIVASLQAAFEADACVLTTQTLCLALSSFIPPLPCTRYCEFHTHDFQKATRKLLVEFFEMAKTLPWNESK